MKQLSLIALLIAFLFATPHSYAGFAIKKTTKKEFVSGNVFASGVGQRLIAADEFVSMLHSYVNHDEDNNPHPKDTSGWEGIVALCCGVLAPFTLISAIPAIIFGALGIGRGKKHQGMAIAGLVLGVVVVFLFAFLIVGLTGGF
ncbi:MAG: DUF4190 domain-containing protein [Taibaiella sp.]|nr:DUF4190 domain-containing protein [Taibaiella sp.]